MQAGELLKPTKDRLLVQRLDGHGRETVTPGGIVIPPTVERGIQTKRDHFRARVLAMGPEAERRAGDELKPGDEVLVYTYADEGDKLYTGERTPYGRIVRLDDILCVVED